MFGRSSFAVMVGVGVAFVAGASSRPAFAIKQFADEFKAVYVKPGSPLAAAVETAKCNVCHVGSNKKALETVAAMPSDPAKADAPTFGALIEQGKLPGGDAK
jgi:hypothetical protein